VADIESDEVVIKVIGTDQADFALPEAVKEMV